MGRLNYFQPIDGILNLRDLRPLMNRRYIMFGHGNKDNWCAWFGKYEPENGDMTIMCSMPQDEDYFSVLKGLDGIMGNHKVYQDVFQIFQKTDNFVDDKLIAEILAISMTYGQNIDWAYNAFMQVYYGMIAEEYYPNTKLGKTVKMNGIARVLLDGVPVSVAAKECCSIDYREIQRQCDMHGIFR